MRLVIAAVGRLKDGPERALFERYWERLEASGRPLALGPLQLFEIRESRASGRAARVADEAERLLAKLSDVDVKIVLDEHGKSQSTAAFAAFLRSSRDAGTGSIAFLIGGPDGHGPAALSAANMSMSLGPMTLPHGLARIVLVEQLYRAATILAGHPYHRT
jgi:23S rRNA (pseudouridine1915-N3)-methyltransferase